MSDSELFFSCTATQPSGQPFPWLRVSLDRVFPMPTTFEGVTDDYGQIWLWTPATHPVLGPFGVPASDGSDWKVTFHTNASQYPFPSFSAELEIRQGATRNIFLLIGPNGYIVRHGNHPLRDLLLPSSDVYCSGPLTAPLAIPPLTLSTSDEDTEISDFNLEPERKLLLPESPSCEGQVFLSQGASSSAQFEGTEGAAAGTKRKLEEVEEHGTDTSGSESKRRRISIQSLLHGSH